MILRLFTDKFTVARGQMFDKTKIYGSLAGLGLFLTLITNSAIAQKEIEIEMSASTGKQTNQFQKIEQPLGLKLSVITVGIGLIGIEFWWFIFSKTKSQKTNMKQEIQKIDSD